MQSGISRSKARVEQMRALVFRGPNQIGVESVPIPKPGYACLSVRSHLAGKERMRRLMELVRHSRVNLRPLLTHTFTLDDISKAYELFANRKDGVLKVAIRP
jgi:Zn-dependent alcohol dehydrogenase